MSEANHSRIAGLAALAALLLAGCNLSRITDAVSLQHGMRNAYLAECNPLGESKYGRDFERGWKQAYYNVSKGGSTCPPSLPPKPYWSEKYQNAEGCARVEAWFEGYRNGTIAAQQKGRHLYNELPVNSLCYREGTRDCNTAGSNVPTQISLDPAGYSDFDPHSVSQAPVDPRALQARSIPVKAKPVAVDAPNQRLELAGRQPTSASSRQDNAKLQAAESTKTNRAASRKADPSKAAVAKPKPKELAQPLAKAQPQPNTQPQETKTTASAETPQKSRAVAATLRHPVRRVLSGTKRDAPKNVNKTSEAKPKPSEVKAEDVVANKDAMRLATKPASAVKNKTVRLPSPDEAMKDEQPREGVALPEPSIVEPKATPATTTEAKTVGAVPAKTKPVAIETVDSNAANAAATNASVRNAGPIEPQPEPTLAEPVANVVVQDKQVADQTTQTTRPQVSRPQVQPQIIDLDNIEEYLTTRGQPAKVSLDAIIQRIPNEIQETPKSVPADLSTSPVSILRKPQKQTKDVLPSNGETSVLRRSAAAPKRSVPAVRPQSVRLQAVRPQTDAFVEAQKLNGAIPKLPLPDMPVPKLVSKFDTELQSVTSPGYQQTPKQMGPTLITRLPEVWDEKR